MPAAISSFPSAPPSYKRGFARHVGESAYPALWRGLIGLWSPELGPTGTVLYDHSGHQNDGTISVTTLSATWRPWKEGQTWCLHMPVTTDVVTVPHADILNPSGAITVLCRLNPNGSYGTGARLVEKELNTSYALMYAAASQSLRFGMDSNSDNANTVEATNAINQTAWSSVVGTWDEVTLRLYVNGRELANQGWVNTVTGDTGDLTFFKDQDSTANSINGLLGQVAIWDRALTPVEIRLLSARPMALLQLRRSARLSLLPLVGGGKFPLVNYEHLLVGEGLVA